MADKKDELPEHIAKFQKLSKAAKKMLSTMERNHRGAYDAAVDKHLMKDGQVDTDLLDDDSVQEKFANEMADHYIAKAKQVFKVKEGEKEKLGDMEKELLMNAYAGTTKAQLLQHIRQYGKRFTFDHFYGELRPGMTEQIQNNLTAASASHLKKEHIGDIVKYTGVSKFVDKDRMRIDDAVGLLRVYEEQGVIAEKALKKALYYKKPAK